MRTSSASEPARIPAITRPRWTLTVFSLVPRRAATCLLSSPWTTSEKTSRSRGVREARRRGVAVDRLAHRRQKLLVVEGLLQEVDRAALDRLDAHRHRGVAGEKDDGLVAAPPFELPLEVEAVPARHPDVEQQTRGPVRRLAGEELRRRREGLGLQAVGAQQPLQGSGHRGLVVDDEDDRLGHALIV